MLAIASPPAVNVAFHSSKRSISRARKHIDDLEMGIASFNEDGCAITIIEEPYDSGAKYVVKARAIKKIPDELESIAADAIYNLRSSLDQAIFSVATVAKKAGGTGISLSSNHWSMPIDSDERKADKRIDKLCKPAGFPSKIGDDIRHFEPYFTGFVENSLLFGLNKAANINKHRFLTPTDIRFGRFELHYVSGPKIQPSEIIVIGQGQFDLTTFPVLGDDTATAPVGQNEIGFYAASSVNRREYEIKSTIDIMFSNIRGLQRRSCVYQLRAVADLCDAVVQRFGFSCLILGLL